ncbi:MAG: sugar ABC transporter permease [Ruminococcaceae bacterium]|nr:sugar ABC transporter permease [Oscillospiraceae bacterium]
MSKTKAIKANNIPAPKKPKAAPETRKKSRASLDARKARSGWLFLLPFIIGLLIIYFPIIADSINFSFAEVTTQTGGGYKVEHVGFENYKYAVVEDMQYTTELVSGIKALLFDIPAIVIFSLFMAVLLNQKMLGRAAFRAIFFIPVILCTGMIDEIDSSNKLTEYMSDSSQSIDMGSGNDTVNAVVSMTDIQWMFDSMKVGTELTQYVVNIMNNIYDIINRSGVQMLIFLAGLQSISPSIYESCSIDGASGWEAFWKITIPMVSPMILVNAIYTVIDALTSATNPVMSYISGVYSGSGGGRELSSAMAWMYFLIVLGIIGLVAAILSAFIFYQRRD